MSRFAIPDYDRQQTKKLHEVIASGKPRKLQSFLKKHDGSIVFDDAVYVDGTAYDLAKAHMPKQIARLDAHMRKHFYG